jgi:DNA polymerase II small subunit/DNA polymerase delta subunit B
MIVKVKTLSTTTYKGHFIRKVEDEFGNVYVLIDCSDNEVENAAANMKVNEFPYSSISDAKNAINGKAMKYVDSDVFECRREEYLNRFLNKETSWHVIQQSS